MVMDYQVDTLTQVHDGRASPPMQWPAYLNLIATVQRDAGMMVIHVVVAFRPGHPEVSPRQPRVRVR